MRQTPRWKTSAGEISQMGVEEVKGDETEMLAIVHKLGFADLKSFSAALKTNPKEHPASKEAVLGAYRSYIAQMQPKLPGLFGTLPKHQLEVVALPAFMQKDQAAAYYSQGSPGGRAPGRAHANRD